MEAAEATDNLVVIWVDQGFSGENFSRVIQKLCAAKVHVICRTEPGFQVLPKRWIVERTFAWWNQYRRLSKDYELLPVQERVYDLHRHDSFNVETTSAVSSAP
jgi:putative transposase